MSTLKKLTAQQIRRLEKLHALASQGDIAIVNYLFELEERMDLEFPTLKNLMDKVRGEPGHTPTAEELFAIIKPLIPEAPEAKGPTADMVWDAVREMMPERKELMPARSEMIALIEPMVPKLSEIVSRVSDMAKAEIVDAMPSARDVAEEVSGMGRTIRESLEDLPDGQKLRIEAIEGLLELIEEIQRDAKAAASAKGDGKGGGSTFVGGPGGLFVYVDGAKKGIHKVLNYKAGTGVSLAWSLVNGMPTLTISASGGGGSGFTAIETTGGIVNGTNDEFQFAEKPAYIVSDHAWYREGNGWSWSAGTLTATMTIAPQDEVWGFV